MTAFGFPKLSETKTSFCLKDEVGQYNKRGPVVGKILANVT